MIRNLFTLIALAATHSFCAQSGLTNMSFENWGLAFGSQQPVGWFGTTISQQTSGAQQGSSYLRITTTNTSSANRDGSILLAQVNGFSMSPGAPYSQQASSLDGFYKTSGLSAGDSVGISSFLFKQGTVIAVGQIIKTTNTGNWTSFSLPYTYFPASTPDTVWISAFSNMQMAGGGPNAIGSTLDLDNLSLTVAAGIDAHSIGTSFLVYPNPASNELNIFSKDLNAAKVLITDLNGKITDEILITDEKTYINLEKYSAGIYFYSITGKDNSRLLYSKLTVVR